MLFRSWVDPDTFAGYLEDIVKSLSFHGIEKVVIVNGHGGNRAALRQLGQRARERLDVYVAVWTWFEAVEKLVKELFEGNQVLHADGPEISALLALNDKRVKEEKFQEAERDAAETWGNFIHGAEISYDVADFSKNGAVGHPTDASKEKGEKLVEKAIDELCGLVDWLEEQTLDSLKPKPHK